MAEGKHDIFENVVLVSIAGRHNKTVPQVILRWLTQRGIVAIPKSVNRGRIVEDLDIFDFDLSPDDMKSIRSLDRESSSFFDHRNPAIVKALGEMDRAT